MGAKRTKKDVADAYNRGFHDGYLAAPSPFTIFLRSIWRRRKLKRLKRAYLENREKRTNRPNG